MTIPDGAGVALHVTGRDPSGAWQIAFTLDAGLQRLACMALRHELRPDVRRRVQGWMIYTPTPV